jgi:hypothetical protein
MQRLKILFLKDPPDQRERWTRDVLEAIGDCHEVIEFDSSAPLAPQFQGADFVIDTGGDHGTRAWRTSAIR